MAIDLALRYPRAARLYAMHNANEVWLPPPAPGIVAATLAANDRMAALARGCAGAGEIIRIRQPIDLNRFNPHGRWPGESPSSVLLVGNYYDVWAQRIDQLKAAWASVELSGAASAGRSDRGGRRGNGARGHCRRLWALHPRSDGLRPTGLCSRALRIGRLGDGRNLRAHGVGMGFPALRSG